MESTLQPYGNFWAGDGLWNIPIGGLVDIEAAFLFRANDYAAVNCLRYFNTWSTERPGYHAGDGGRLRIELMECPVVPDERQIAYAEIAAPAKVSKFPLVPLSKKVMLFPGRRYALVFSNFAESYQTNWASINTMAVMSARPRKQQNETEVLIRSDLDREWKPFHPEIESVTPIFTIFNRISLQLEDQIAIAGYGGMESWVAEPRRVAGDEAIRQVFYPIRDVDVASVAIRIARSGTPGPLKASLTRGLLPLAIATADPLSAPPVFVPSTVDLRRIGHDWVVMEFPKPVRLTGGIEHRITFTSQEGTAGEAYAAFPLRDGAEFGFASPWANSWAEFTTSGPGGWRRWETWGKPSSRGDLQIYFNATKE